MTINQSVWECAISGGFPTGCTSGNLAWLVKQHQRFINQSDPKRRAFHTRWAFSCYDLLQTKVRKEKDDGQSRLD